MLQAQLEHEILYGSFVLSFILLVYGMGVCTNTVYNCSELHALMWRHVSTCCYRQAAVCYSYCYYAAVNIYVLKLCKTNYL
jgi:hypothetical protein